jgi:hypothetical protein
MSVQVGLITEAPTAIAAFEGLILRVGANMGLQMMFLLKSSITEITLESSLIVVNPYMTNTVVLAIEITRTSSTTIDIPTITTFQDIKTRIFRISEIAVFRIYR